MPSREGPEAWNPETVTEVSPEDYERQVARWLELSGVGLRDLRVAHLRRLPGASGEYEFDAVAEFSAFDGASFVVLVECKRHKNPVKREAILALEAKRQEVGAHKAMLFSTSGFQQGALEYATAHGIATLTFVDGRSTYETRDLWGRHEPPPWVRTPRYAGFLLSVTDDSVQSHLVDDEYLDAISEWFRPAGSVDADAVS